MTFLGLRPSPDTALIDAASGATVSYRQLFDDAEAVRRALASATLARAAKQLVFVRVRNDRFSVTTYLGAQLGDHASVLLDGSRPLVELADVLSRYQPEVVAGPSGTAAELASLGHALARVEPMLEGEIVALAPTTRPAIHPDLALLLSTSGTTGTSKLVRLSRRNVEANARAIAKCLGIGPADRPVTSLPLHYSFGLSVLNSHLLAGAAVVLTTDGVMQRSFWDALRHHRCTTIAGVPYTYRLLERIGYRALQLPDLLTMQQAGGALDRALTEQYAQHMHEKGGRLFVMYGQTEATARIAYVPPERLADKLGSAGRSIPGGRLRIEDGEVVYEGPNVMLGYATDRADLSLGDELGGTLRTGDLGYLDGDGFLFLTGRSKRIAKVFGLRVNLDEVELLLREHGHAAVVAEDDRIWGFCAFDTEASLVDVRDALARRLHLHPSGLQLRHVKTLPVTSSGKTDYQELARWMRPPTETPETPNGAEDPAAKPPQPKENH